MVAVLRDAAERQQCRGARRCGRLMAHTVTFDPAKQGSAEICAAFLALVVYPKDEKMREQLLCAEMNRQLREWARVDPEWATMCQSWPPKWLLFDPQRAERLHSQAMAVFNGCGCDIERPNSHRRS